MKHQIYSSADRYQEKLLQHSHRTDKKRTTRDTRLYGL